MYCVYFLRRMDTRIYLGMNLHEKAIHLPLYRYGIFATLHDVACIADRLIPSFVLSRLPFFPCEPQYPSIFPGSTTDVLYVEAVDDVVASFSFQLRESDPVRVPLRQFPQGLPPLAAAILPQEDPRRGRRGRGGQRPAQVGHRHAQLSDHHKEAVRSHFWRATELMKSHVSYVRSKGWVNFQFRARGLVRD